MQALLLCSSLVQKVTNLRITDSIALPKPIDLCEEIPRSVEQKTWFIAQGNDSFIDSRRG